MLRSDQVLVTIGTPCSMSAVGGTETFNARVRHAPEFIAYAAFDAGLIEFDGTAMRWTADGTTASLADIEARHGEALRANLGIRSIRDRFPPQVDLQTDIAAPLPHDLESGGLRRLAGFTFRDIRESAFKDMFSLFDDDPRLAPSLQSQLFAYAGLGALAALPKPLHELLDPFEFRVAAATAFSGLDAYEQWIPPGSDVQTHVRDKFASRLAASLSTHGPALVSTMLAPAYSISRALKVPNYLDSLRASVPGYKRVTQAPLVSAGACASSSIALTEIAPQLLFEYPGYRRPKLALWIAADAAMQPHFGLLDAFGTGTLMTQAKLAQLNADRVPAEQRRIDECLAPFDIDAQGTVVGHAGSGLVITTLQFALEHQLDITSIIAGWGQSGEAGGKAHFAGVGFGGENAIVQALDMAYQAHGYGIKDFQYLVAHATGTRTNSKTDLTAAANGRMAAAERQGFTATLSRMHVGTPKAVGDGHSMGETGLKAVSQALNYVLGEAAVGVPTLKHMDPDLGPPAEQFVLQRELVAGNPDGGALCATQGFGGYNGALVLRAAHADALKRYACDPAKLAAYLERWPEIRRARQQNERRWRLTNKAALGLAELHRWAGAE